MSQQTSKPWSHKPQRSKLWSHIGDTCLLIITSGIYSSASTAGFDTAKNATMTSIAAMVALSNATGNGTAVGAKGGYKPINGTHGNGTHLASIHAPGKNTSGIARQRHKKTGLFNPNHPSAPGNSSSERSRNSRESAFGQSAPRRRRQAGLGTFVGCSPRIASALSTTAHDRLFPGGPPTLSSLWQQFTTLHRPICQWHLQAGKPASQHIGASQPLWLYQWRRYPGQPV